MTVRVVIADDHRIFLTALKTMMAGDPDISVVGTASNGTELIDLAELEKPDVVVVDIGMPGMSGLEAVGKLQKKGFSGKVLILSAYSDRRFVIEALSAGAAGYVVKSAAASELSRAICSVAQGKSYLCPEVASAVVDAVRSGGGGADKGTAKLAPRERIVVRLLAEGKTSAQIAEELHIAVSTVDTHRRNILRKLGLHRVAELTRYAIREGIAMP